jgi:hypothetical protein
MLNYFWGCEEKKRKFEKKNSEPLAGRPFVRK